MNNYATYPIENESTSFINRRYQVNTKKEKQCLRTQSYKEECKPDPMFGYHKPLSEECPTITGNMVPPEEQCNSLWNNMTKRKGLIKRI